MTSYKGTTITYDELGNPLSYYNGTSYTFTWEGRRLISATKGGKTYTFTYNADGLRTSKTVDGVTTKYVYEGDMLLGEINPSYILFYVYTDGASPSGMHYYNGTSWSTYVFEKNLQGDVVAVYTNTGTLVASYKYTAYGTMTVSASGIASHPAVKRHPVAYRGYFYDNDLGFYYCNSRYYDPKICRWINPEPNMYKGLFDNETPVLAYNVYAYCMNNPVNNIDPTGEWTFSFNLGFFIGLGGGYSFNIGFSVDSEDMLAFQFTYSVPNDGETRNTVIGGTVGFSVSMQYTEYNSVAELNSRSKSAGVNTPIGSFDIIKDRYNKDVGWAISVGPSVGMDFHVNETKTYTIGGPLPSLVRKIKEWMCLVQ